MRKTFKKMLAVIIAAFMVCVAAFPAFAADEYKITISNQSNNVSITGNEYSAYKIFDVKYNTGNKAYSYTLSKEFEGLTYQGKTGDELAKALADLNADSTKLNAFAETALKYAIDKNIKPANTITAQTEKGNVMTLNEAGYYLVAGTATADGNQTVTAACALTTTDPNAEINVKADAPKIDKVIVEGSDKLEGTSADIGSVVNFELNSKVPVMTGYETYKYIVHDKMSSGLTFDEKSVEVSIGGKTLDPATDYTLEVPGADGETFTITIADLTKYTADDAIVIKYSATVNENALTTTVETNTVELEYSNNPNDDKDTAKTPEDTVYVYDFDIIIDKYAATNKDTKLEGAVFVLKNGEGEYYYWNETEKKVEWVENEDDATRKTTDVNGKETFKGLEEGTYYLVEIEAPAGYNKLDNPIPVVITAEYNTDGTIKEKGNGSTTTVVEGTNDYYLTTDVANSTGPQLPGTGGIGTTIFYVIGAVLMLGAVVMLIARKKSSAKA